MQQHGRKEVDQETIDAMSVDVDAKRGNAADGDVMADYDGFLEMRKKDRNMQRNTMMSQVDKLVKTLHSDIDRMLESEKRKRRADQQSKGGENS